MTTLSIQQNYGNEIYRLNFFFDELNTHCFVVYHNCPQKSPASSQIRNAETKGEFLDFVKLIISNTACMNKTTANWNHLRSELLKMTTNNIAITDGVFA